MTESPTAPAAAARPPLPAPHPPVPVTFTHLSVHRGHDEVARFPIGPHAPGCRCCTAPSSVESAAAEDENRVAWGAPPIAETGTTKVWLLVPPARRIT